jgi:ribosomal protein S18 acetylase RimI-like enzyme
LSARGYCSHTPTLIMARSLRDAQFAAHDDVQLEAEPTPGFARVFSDARVSDADHDERWGLILRAPQPKAHAVIAIEGRPAAVGLCVVTGEQAGLYAMRTPPWARRRGLARRVVNACLAWATERSASHAYLQVEENNAAAIALYEGAGFRSCGRYAYWRPA